LSGEKPRTGNLFCRGSGVHEHFINISDLAQVLRVHMAQRLPMCFFWSRDALFFGPKDGCQFSSTLWNWDMNWGLLSFDVVQIKEKFDWWRLKQLER
jgi:hypothetical protein